MSLSFKKNAIAWELALAGGGGGGFVPTTLPSFYSFLTREAVYMYGMDSGPVLVTNSVAVAIHASDIP